MPAATFPDRVVEFFTLREAARELGAVPAETRATAFRDLRLAFQRRAAAETLWPRGNTAEALKLAANALGTASASLASLSIEPPPPWLAPSRALAEEATKRLEGVKLPELESDATAADEETFRAIIDTLLAIEDRASLSLAAPSDLERIRNARITWAVAAGAVLLFLLIAAFRAPRFAHATASGQYGPDNGPEKAYDGDVATGWDLPDHVGQGWIDFELGKARPVRALHILPSNPPYNDRDIKDARIEAMLGEAIVKSIDLTFPEPTGQAARWSDVALDAPKCDHIRITAKSNYKLGLGIAEIELK